MTRVVASDWQVILTVPVNLADGRSVLLDIREGKAAATSS